MKKILVLLCSLPFYCFAQTQFDFKDIQGKWQEVSRTKKNATKLDFTDTLRVEIRHDGFMMVRHTKGSTFTGEAEISGKKLKFENTTYFIVESSEQKLVLNDKEGNHHFVKMIEFTNAPVPKVIPGVEEGTKDISLSTLQGKWTIYKKTDPNFNRITFYLKSIDFKEDKGNATYTGTASFNNNDSVYSTEAFIYIKGNDLVISSDEETFKAKVLKSDGEELILESGTIHYFLKRFGK